MEALLLAFGVVFVAELGDKSQLAALTFAARFPARWVVLGLVVASVATTGLSVVLGATLGAVLPDRPLAMAAGLAFLAFAWWTWRSRPEDSDRDAQRHVPATSGMRIAVTAGATVAMTELGDKTMLTTLALAARADPLAVFAGAAAAMSCTGVLAVIAGRELRKRVPEPVLRGLAAAAFALAGLFLLATPV